MDKKVDSEKSRIRKKIRSRCDEARKCVD